MQLCWDNLNRDNRINTQRSRRPSDTESQIDSDDDNRIVQENFSMEATPVDNVSKCLELVMVFLDCHIHETANAPTTVVKEAWKVFSEVVKKICRKGCCLQYSLLLILMVLMYIFILIIDYLGTDMAIEKIVKLWYREQRNIWWPNLCFSPIPVSSQDPSNSQYYSNKAFVCFFFENEEHPFVRCILENHQRSGLLRSLINQLRQAKSEISGRVKEQLSSEDHDDDTSLLLSEESSSFDATEESDIATKEIRVPDFTVPSSFNLVDATSAAKEYSELLSKKPFHFKKLDKQGTKNGYYQLDADNRLIKRFTSRQTRRPRSLSGSHRSITGSSCTSETPTMDLLSSTSEDEAVEHITNRNQMSITVPTYSVPDTVITHSGSSYHSLSAHSSKTKISQPISSSSAISRYSPATMSNAGSSVTNDVKEKRRKSSLRSFPPVNPDTNNLTADYDYQCEDENSGEFPDYDLPADTEQIKKFEDRARLIQRRWRKFIEDGKWLIFSLESETEVN